MSHRVVVFASTFALTAGGLLGCGPTGSPTALPTDVDRTPTQPTEKRRDIHVDTPGAKVDVHRDPARYAELARRYKELEPIVGKAGELRARAGDRDAAREMFADASGDEREEMRGEIDEAEADIDRLTDELRVTVREMERLAGWWFDLGDPQPGRH